MAMRRRRLRLCFSDLAGKPLPSGQWLVFAPFGRHDGRSGSAHVGLEHVCEAFPALAERVGLISAGPPLDTAAAEHESAQQYLMAADLNFQAVAALQLGQLDRAWQKSFHAGDARGSAMFRHTSTAFQK